MSFSGESSDSECPPYDSSLEEIIKNEKKYLPARFVEKWLDLFKPWLARDILDPNKPFCLACNRCLTCNKFNLQRHQMTTKHNSNLEAFMSKQTIGEIKERRKVVKASPETEADDKFESVDFEVGKREKEMKNAGEILQTAGGSGHKDRQKLLLQIQKDKDELITPFNELCSSAASSAEKKEKNHVDLFFDSVSSSVKALTPKLIAEAKLRVSQLVCELELRAITESKSMNG